MRGSRGWGPTEFIVCTRPKICARTKKSHTIVYFLVDFIVIKIIIIVMLGM